MLEALINLAQDDPLPVIFVVSLVTALLIRKLHKMNQRLQQRYDAKAD